MKARKDQICEDTAKWFAIYTRSRAEKMVAANLQKKGIVSYLPLIKTTKKYTKRTKIVEKPLLNSYVFVYIRKSEYLDVLRTEHVLGFLKLANVLIAIPEEEIELLKWVVGEKLVENISTDFSEGNAVEIVGGQLTGMKGKVVSRLSKKHILVNLETIGYQLELKIPETMLQHIRHCNIAS